MLPALRISFAAESDIPAMAALVNRAYRGEASRQGWTTEADLLDGPRTDEADLRQLSAAPGATFLLARTAAGELVGSVYTKPEAPDLYVGMLSVDPTRQAAGIGRQLLAAAEAQARQAGFTDVLMSVISVRAELIAWYERLGFQRTGEVQPFPLHASPSIPKQPLELLLLRKMV
ncbi:GNAT family N-acetyltransferase [Microvirga sp. STR05]|uniref:GNAT family N-acetyltransferase n=1 Tax=Hymenobacter duratus TaxID=2771356 RepID=A0ABR8JLR5_9BACT|nr:GNAT family N-acetyltransferase [Hymenobacter duratus]MBD2716666.1 GNAT family N-acetyltransferase [Hymenobacter duratus]MBR7951581.1 GNAT family N-acetyltransferase [Microvirga sp. STR05]